MLVEAIVVLIVLYVSIIAVMLLFPNPLQSYAMYLNFINYPFFVNWRAGGERFGFRSGSLRTVHIRTKDGLTLGAWHILPRKFAPAPRPGASPAVADDALIHQQADSALKSASRVYLYFHGNAGNRATFHRNDFYKMMSSIDDNSHVLAIDYRGFGDSSSAIPTEETIAIDAMAAYDWLIAHRIAPSKIVLVGHSLGTGVATDLAFALTVKSAGSPTQPLFGGLILLSGYASIGDAALGYPMVPLLRPFSGIHFAEKWLKSKLMDRWDSVTKMRSIKAPILIIHGSRDFEILPWQSRALFLEAAGGRIGQQLVNPDGYWDLRRPSSKFSVNELDGVAVTDLGREEGELWTVDPLALSGNSVQSIPRHTSTPVWLLLVANGGHNTLSGFQLVKDTIESWTNECSSQ